MPTYDYACTACGPFALLRSMADRDLAADCPRCKAPSGRVINGAPRLEGLEAGTRRMMAAQEKADGPYGRLRHAAGCGCCT